MLKPIGFENLLGQTIKKVENGHKEKPDHNSYGVITITTETNEIFVFSSSYLRGEITVSEEPENWEKLIDLALQNGWFFTDSLTDSNILTHENHKQKAARWFKVNCKDKKVTVPHFLRRELLKNES
jgi:hypothetical protein